MLKPLGIILASLPLLASAAEDPLQAFTQVTPKNFDAGGDESLQFHLNAESYLRSTTIARGDKQYLLNTVTLPGLNEQSIVVAGQPSSFAAYVANDPLLDSVLVLQGGQIVFEAYPRMTPEDRHFGWSVTKVLTSATLATLVAEGKVRMDATIEDYLPELSGTAWDGTTVYNIANMASGIDCRDSDGYQDNTTCVYRMEESLGIVASTGRDESFLSLIHDMKRLRPAGERNEYVSANTNVLMLVIERVTGQSYADAVEERIWQRMGAESDALMAVSKEGHAYASGGLMARLRDLARFGLVFTDSERFPGIANTMMADLRSGVGISRSKEELKWLARDHGDDLPLRAGWQWDQVWDDGGAFKGGYLGQGLYVDPARDLVVAWYGTGLDFSAKQTDMLSVARQLAVSGFFDISSEPKSLKAIIQSRNNEYEAAFKAQDIPALLALHTDDVVFMSSHRERVVGIAKLEASLEEELSLGESSIRLTTEEVTHSGEFALEVGRYELSLGADSEEPISDAGDYLVLWRQNAEGLWRIYRDITSSTQPLP
ncbi:serine hydrolase [Congregibacter brevis]|uniref:Serine hydrolase n=1 Tax=Congregibacter brevis TaxID=3081201 RepID=A0ABZ0IDB7_9GAMM|nr:serine hydrolase [Congregibacter sp. IMCC45268]